MKEYPLHVMGLSIALALAAIWFLTAPNPADDIPPTPYIEYRLPTGEIIYQVYLDNVPVYLYKGQIININTENTKKGE